MLTDEDPGPIYRTEENPDDPDGEFRLTETDTWEVAYTTRQAEIGFARLNAAGFGLDDLSGGRSRHSGDQDTPRWICTHMIEEYARRNGHADLIRERVDGSTGE